MDNFCVRRAAYKDGADLVAINVCLALEEAVEYAVKFDVEVGVSDVIHAAVELNVKERCWGRPTGNPIWEGNA
ncbi:MAG: hypothetical protein LBT97_03285 [Planctomycetota bacterium]|jgi:hypothetical protein|nr:hypothetical protein [Planctomycetota bacterium]